MMQRGYPIVTNGLIIALVLGAAACGDIVGPDLDPEVTDPEVTLVPIAAARLTIGPDNDITTLARGGEATIMLPLGTATVALTAEWLDAAGRILSGYSPAELELSISGREFTMEPGTFSGTISGLYIGSHALTVRAWHRQEARFVFGAVLYIVVNGNECESDPCFGPWDY